ncbi:uncharacterized protein LOC106763661 [Vigna radiata var. radiata]|uniref:Uncharacterized protein LOC106763661 n=1 Tax=Vigna radiata var. radiata TaxID=3916 RepID=A0A1S3UBG5_VIGRR|nr:uncharacterized protein LOC106763661 [Vigna radiata var. radiata]
MSMAHSCSSSTCNDYRRKHMRSVSSRGDASLICHCGENNVLRTARTTKNRGKQFWGCPRYKLGSENGCNFFRWFSDWGVEESISCELLEANDVRLVKSVEKQGVKQMSDVEKVVVGLQREMKYLVVVFSVLFVMNTIIIAMMMRRA